MTKPREKPYKLKLKRKNFIKKKIFYIQLTKNKLAIVDKEDFEDLSRFNWYAQIDRKTGEYTAKRGTLKNKIRKSISMHRYIMRCPDNMQVDHINHDTLDNRKKNLRICTIKENNRNRKFRGCTSTPYGTWNARIVVDYKQINLGNFRTQKEAEKAYKKATRKYYGEFACK